jgi:nucleotide-binding universal stress UspA family protein
MSVPGILAGFEAVVMNGAPSTNLDILWACHGTPAALKATDAIRRWLLPVAGRLDVLAVAPVGRPTVERVLPRSQERKERALLEAREAAQSAIIALGHTDVRLEVLARWGTPSREISAEADRYDVVVLGNGGRGRGSLSSTTTEVLDTTPRPVLVAREDQSGPVLIVANAERWFRKTLEQFHRLHLDNAIPVVLAAVQVPAKPFGGMLLSFSEHVREQEQALHDVQHQELSAVFEEGRTALSSEGREVRILHVDREGRDWSGFFDDLSPSLIVVGDMPAGGHARHPDSIAARVAAEASCSVLVAR